MKNAPTPFESESALDQRQHSSPDTAPRIAAADVLSKNRGT